MSKWHKFLQDQVFLGAATQIGFNCLDGHKKATVLEAQPTEMER